tara:strand:- start:5218 stop:6393 length:1176 start_codon:yes stop_codon:yes gene_type:complete
MEGQPRDRQRERMIYLQVGFGANEATRLAGLDPSRRDSEAPVMRTIDGKLMIQRHSPVKSQQTAKRIAQRARENGRNARVIERKGKGDWVILEGESKKFRRIFNSEMASMTLLQRAEMARNPTPTKKKKRFTLRRAKKPNAGLLTKKEQEDAIEAQDFNDLVIKYGGRAGYDSPEVVAKAMKEAQANRALRAESELRDKRIEAAQKRQSELKTKLEAKEYQQAKANYDAGVPLDTLVKYNSLEIATTSTGLLAGGALAATSVASAGFIPLAMLLGLASAKVIRNVPQLKRTVNAGLESVKNPEVIDSLIVSKDKGQPAIWSLGLLREPKRVKPIKPSAVRVQEQKEKLQRKQDRADLRKAEKLAIKRNTTVDVEIEKIQKKRDKRKKKRKK